MFGLSMGRILETNSTYEHIIFWTASAISLFGAVLVTLCCYVIIVCYYVKYVYFNTRHVNTNNVATVTKLLRHDDVIMTTTTTEVETARREKVRRARLREIVVTGLTPVPFVVGWSFFLVTQTYEVASQTYIMNDHYNVAMIIVPWCVSAINPLMYILLTASIRKHVRCYWRKLSALTGISSGERSVQSSCSPESIQLTEV